MLYHNQPKGLELFIAAESLKSEDLQKKNKRNRYTYSLANGYKDVNNRILHLLKELKNPVKSTISVLRAGHIMQLCTHSFI